MCPKNQTPTAKNKVITKKYTPYAELDEYGRFLLSQAWVKFAKLVRGWNPLCQHIDANGVRCLKPSQVVHHILDGRTNPSRRLDPANVAALCHEHHLNAPGETEENNRTLAPTCVWINFQPIYHDHPKPKPLKSMEVVITEAEKLAHDERLVGHVRSPKKSGTLGATHIRFTWWYRRQVDIIRISVSSEA
jgi:hypothetical protein